MAYRLTPNLIFPIGNFKNISSGFGEMNVYDKKLWGKHLGIDISVPCDTKVFSVGRGIVVYSKLHPGEFSEEGDILKRNWGGIVIIAHKEPRTKEVFYSLYGHLGKRFVKRGDSIEMGGIIGTIGRSLSESNGAWEEEHLHFGVYTGPYHGKVLPGYFKERADGESVTEVEYWKEPVSFIKNYNSKTV
jgi:murein DD-endopeptidase MepM/ murein hydrolase activator NlpD